eukprot:NODE_5022_length_709_cov_176.111684_g4859_i0.p1 GENE.NODE_5022_length_709_cov_176.111684_g4859_i0~~NODE_5022_length_709_cov_176.111684_g4859_i0.p1  ORF type:complete len:213 (+),score=34.50 NODE_5022_length_709_cov_176.111684_g4859_i0:59-697(+)
MNETDSQYIYKVLVVGDYAVGKTSLIRRYCTGEFTTNYRITIGVDFCLKSLTHNAHDVSLQLWDIAGHERFGAMTRVYYKFAVAAVVVFDLTRATTLESARRWRQDINEKISLPDTHAIPMILLANKADMDSDLPSERLDQFVKEHGFIGWPPTSAKSGQNVDLAFRQLLDSIFLTAKNMDVTIPRHSNDILLLQQQRTEQSKKTKQHPCCT